MKTIYLIGARGAGKTSVGSQLASRLKVDFHDSDDMVCARAGSTVTDIIDRDCWQEFRRIENQVLAECLELTGAVVATGGGAVLHHDVWDRIRQAGVVVWLMAPVDVLVERVSGDAANIDNRPSLTGGTVRDEFAAVYKEREPLYEKLAHYVINTCSLDRSGVVADIVNVIGMGKEDIFK